MGHLALTLLPGLKLVTPPGVHRVSTDDAPPSELKAEPVEIRVNAGGYAPKSHFVTFDRNCEFELKLESTLNVGALPEKL